ncbi:MAG TPA: hypothetical protein VLM79_40090, partial [Kofleriaceae bacterium]|nr:hypothetical protein [Kofleriaceae bacterium]
MTDPSIPPCVLVVADSDRIAELVDALSELHGVDVLVSSGGDDTLELFEARRPVVVVLTASLAMGDARSLMVTLRGMVPRGEVAIIVIGDDAGPVRTALDALDYAADRFVNRPLSSKSLRFAVTGGIEAVRLVRGSPAPPRPALPVAVGTAPGGIELPRTAMHAIRRQTPNSSITAIMPLPMTAAAAAATIPDAPVAAAARAAMRARWEALADSIADSGDAEPDEARATDSADPEPTPTPVAPSSERSSRITTPVDPAELARLAELAKKSSSNPSATSHADSDDSLADPFGDDDAEVVELSVRSETSGVAAPVIRHRVTTSTSGANRPEASSGAVRAEATGPASGAVRADFAGPPSGAVRREIGGPPSGAVRTDLAGTSSGAVRSESSGMSSGAVRSESSGMSSGAVRSEGGSMSSGGVRRELAGTSSGGVRGELAG